ncbi:MAG: ribosome recycling factor [Deltaproteobacteria bacterium]|nr:ribosome recycling factor [Deltaproteobacteria bacterium]
MEPKVIKESEAKMKKTLSSLDKELGKVRTGRASLALLDDIRMDYYGAPTPLNQVATLSVPESRLIVIQPWDTSTIGEIERALLKSELGMTPVNDGKVIRITIPKLTEERRKELVKVVKKMGENSKIGARNIRREAIERLRKMEKAKEISEDELHQWQTQVQKITDKFIGQIDELIEAKEKEVMEI